MLGLKEPLDPVARRRAMLQLYTWVIAGVALTVIVIVLVLSLSKRNDRLAVIANFLGAGTLILALLAGFVALQAYAVTTGLPDLKFQVFHEFGKKNLLEFLRPEHPGEVQLRPNQHFAYIRLKNLSRYSAKNPSVIVRFDNMALDSGESEAGPGWLVVETIGVVNAVALQWDGGSAYSIHGYSTRRLPSLRLDGLRTLRSEAAKITFEILADGYTREVVTIEVFFRDQILPSMGRRAESSPEWL